MTHCDEVSPSCYCGHIRYNDVVDVDTNDLYNWCCRCRHKWSLQLNLTYSRRFTCDFFLTWQANPQSLSRLFKTRLGLRTRFFLNMYMYCYMKNSGTYLLWLIFSCIQFWWLFRSNVSLNTR